MGTNLVFYFAGAREGGERVVPEERGGGHRPRTKQKEGRKHLKRLRRTCKGFGLGKKRDVMLQRGRLKVFRGEKSGGSGQAGTL